MAPRFKVHQSSLIWVKRVSWTLQQKICFLRIFVISLNKSNVQPLWNAQLEVFRPTFRNYISSSIDYKTSVEDYLFYRWDSSIPNIIGRGSQAVSRFWLHHTRNKVQIKNKNKCSYHIQGRIPSLMKHQDTHLINRR